MEDSDKKKETYLASKSQAETTVVWFGLLYNLNPSPSPSPSPSVVFFLHRLVLKSKPDGVTIVNYVPVV